MQEREQHAIYRAAAAVLSTSVSCSPSSMREVVFKRPLSWWPGGKKEVQDDMRYAKFMLTPAAAGAALILSSAQTARADFSGYYDPSNWTFSPGLGDGFVNTAGAPTTISITGADNGMGETNADYTIAAAASGTWSFDWSFSTQDSDWFYDKPMYLRNGVETWLMTGAGTTGSGSISLTINAGDIIGFRQGSDGALGAGTLTITNFVAPVPAPGALALLGLAAVSGRSRRRRC
jgi:hypothetical protein